MDTLVFIAALAIGVAIMAWYVANEARASDGAFGVFALKGDGTAGEMKEDAAEAGRYRARRRLTPDRAGLPAPAPHKAYRMKAAEQPSWRDETLVGADQPEAV